MPTQASHGFSVGDVIRHNGTIWVKAQADSAANAESLAVCETVSDVNNFTAVTHGKITLSGLTAGMYYLSAATAGATTQTPPVADGTVNKPVFYAISATVAYVVNLRGAVNGGTNTVTATRGFYIDAGSMIPRTTNGPATLTEELTTNDIMSDSLLYSGATEEGAQFRTIVPYDWDGNAVNAIFFWDAATGGDSPLADGVTWGLSLKTFSDNSVLDDSPLPASVDTDDTVLTVGNLHETTISADITIGNNPVGGSLMWGEVTRVVGDTNDTMTEDAKLLGVIILYTVIMHGDHYVEWTIPAASFGTYTTNGAESKKVVYSGNEVDAYAFDPSTEEAIHLQFELPQDYQSNTPIRWGINWDSDTAGSGTAVFGLSGGSFGDSDALNTALGTERTITDTVLTVGDRHRSPNDSTGITLAGSPVAGDWVLLKLVVKTSGTIAVDTLFLGIQLQYQRSSALQNSF